MAHFTNQAEMDAAKEKTDDCAQKHVLAQKRHQVDKHAVAPEQIAHTYLPAPDCRTLSERYAIFLHALTGFKIKISQRALGNRHRLIGSKCRHLAAVAGAEARQNRVEYEAVEHLRDMRLVREPERLRSCLCLGHWRLAKPLLPGCKQIGRA